VKRSESAWGEPALLVLAITLPSISAWLYFVVLAGTGSMTAVYAGTKLFQFSLPAAWFLLNRNKVEIPAGGKGRGWKAGLASGLVIVAMLWLVYRGLPQGGSLLAGLEAGVRIKLEQVGAVTLPRMIMLAVFLSVIHSFLEEYYWRWFLYGRLRIRIGKTPALLVSSFGFMAHHVIILHIFLGSDRWLATVMFSLAIAAAGGLWTWLYGRSGSLIGPWISHMLADFGVFWVGYELVLGSFQG
jgi:membrane protease YdiL (CAAX protease family)